MNYPYETTKDSERIWETVRSGIDIIGVFPDGSLTRISQDGEQIAIKFTSNPLIIYNQRQLVDYANMWGLRYLEPKDTLGEGFSMKSNSGKIGNPDMVGSPFGR
jgi:hypothetical protein